MIGWYSNAGYFDGNADDLKNISQVTWLDVNAPFTIPVLKQIPQTVTESDAVGSDDLTAFYRIPVDEYFGPDWYLTYLAGWEAPYSVSDSQEYIEASEVFTSFLPGWNKAWPNTIAFAEQYINEHPYTFVLYIPNLKRLFKYGGGYENIPQKVNDDGTLINLPDADMGIDINTMYFRWGSFNFFGGIGFNLLVLAVPFSSYDVLKNAKNFRTLRVGATIGDAPSNDFKYSIKGWTTYIPSGPTIPALFSDCDKVDFEGGEVPGPAPEPPGPSEPGGGGGTYDETSDPIEFPDPPALTASDTGMISLYSPSIGQLRDLANYMWSDAFDIDTFKKLFANPMDVIIGLSMVPVRPTIGGIKNIIIGFVDTGVACSPVENQYVTVECGSLDIKEFFGTALDYSPYTKFSIYLPFIGTKELKTDDIMGRNITVRYTIDVLSGACTAHVKCGDSVLYQYSGSCSTTIPVTSQNWSQMITSIIQLAGAGIATAVSGGAAAASLIPAAANTIASMKPEIQRAGAVSGSAGFLGIQYPYLIWEHPRQALPTGYNKFVGYPSNITYALGELSGFTEIESIHLEGIPATQNELTEIESLLKGGVIF